jgi:hypothetical protein
MLILFLNRPGRSSFCCYHRLTRFIACLIRDPVAEGFQSRDPHSQHEPLMVFN